MEKAIFCDIRHSKKGKLVGQLVFENQKKMPVPSETKLSESYDGRECQVLRKGGVIQSISINNKKIYKKNMKHTRPKSQSSKAHKDSKTATAPYNFIPLNDVIVKGQEIPSFDTYRHKTKRFNGYIDYDLEALSPLYIRDTYTDSEFKLKEDKDRDNSDFFSPGGEVKIPGSSVRGMTRTLVEIVSWSKFTFFDDYRLFYRAVAEEGSFGKEYRDFMKGHKVDAGYLTKENGKYLIIPAKRDGNGERFVQVEKRNVGIKTEEEFLVRKQNNGKYLVIPGNMEGQAKRDWLINVPDESAERISILCEDIKIYKLDFNRYEDTTNVNDANKRDGNLLRQLSVSKDNIVPCFYRKWEDSSGKERIVFGHTRYFRLPYKYTIGDYVPSELWSTDIVDMAECIFGRQSETGSTIASRVFFEDAKLVEGQKDIFFDEKIPCTLSNPKPTAFQHYLEQTSGADAEPTKNWNSLPEESNIRGYKLYWHRKNNKWSKGIVKNNTEIEQVDTSIKAIKSNTKFKGMIRYENLTAEELGALLFVLKLPKSYCHKLGMGKSLGLGSVKIVPSLFIIDREKHYTKLFDGDDWNLVETKGDINKFKKEFEGYMMKYISDNEKGNSNALWETPRVKQLGIMLDWENVNTEKWLKRTNYMDVKQFEKRPILSKPLPFL